jgi:DNA-binding NarL/FixJ family response regulator
METTALIVEDHPLFRSALLDLVAGLGGVSGALGVGSAEEALRLGATLGTLQLILLDPGLPGLNGVEAIVAMRRKWPDVPLIVVSASEDRQQATAALRAGAAMAVSKGVSSEVLVDIARRVLAGAAPPAAWITHAGASATGSDPIRALTPRQREIIVLLSQGYSNKEIGLRLLLAEVTIKVHVSSIFRAFNVGNRTQAVLAARSFGLHCPERGR